MWGRNYNQSSGSDVNVNTTIRTVFSELSSLRYGAWNQQISIQLRPCIGTDGNGIRQYDQKRKGQTSLTLENSQTLYEALTKYLIPAWEDIKDGNATLAEFRINPEDLDEPVNVAVQMGSGDKRNALAISLEEDENKKVGFYMHLYLMLKEDNSADPANTFDFHFNPRDYMRNYNPKNGKGTIVDHEPDLYNFVSLLQHHHDILPLAAHGIKYDNAINVRFRGANQQQAAGDDNSANSFGMNTPESYTPPVSSYSGAENMDFVPFN